MAQIESGISEGQLVALTFTQSGIADGQTTVPMALIETDAVDGALGVTEYVVPFEFTVVAASLASNQARTAGELAIEPSINGTLTGQRCALNVAAPQRSHARFRHGAVWGAPGARLGVKLTTTGWTPTEADLAVTVWLICKVKGI